MQGQPAALILRREMTEDITICQAGLPQVGDSVLRADLAQIVTKTLHTLVGLGTIGHAAAVFLPR